MSSGDSASPCTVCGQVGHWESSHAGDYEDKVRMDKLEKASKDRTNLGLLYVALGSKFNGHNIRQLIDQNL